MGSEEHSAASLAKSFMSDMVEAGKEAKHYLELAQQRQNNYSTSCDQGRKELTLKVGVQVLLNTRNIRWKGPTTPALMPRCYPGPFSVVKAVGLVAYKLDLPKNMHMNSVFHVQLLKL